ncbi:MAG: CHASE domain-containing protein [Hyphomicrobiaceae bacterium]
MGWAREPFGRGIVISIGLWLLMVCAVEAQAHDRFLGLVERLESRSLRTMVANEQVLRGGRALLISEPITMHADFKTHIRALKIERRCSGLQGVGYFIFVSPTEKLSHERDIQAEGFPEYKIQPSGTRVSYSKIDFLEPFDWRNQRAFDYDMYSYDVRRDVMNTARNSGHPIASGCVKLVQETTKDVQAGFLLFLPHSKPRPAHEIGDFINDCAKKAKSSNASNSLRLVKSE